MFEISKVYDIGMQIFRDLFRTDFSLYNLCEHTREDQGNNLHLLKPYSRVYIHRIVFLRDQMQPRSIAIFFIGKSNKVEDIEKVNNKN